MMFSRKDLIKLLVPLVIEQILAVLVGMVDVMMVSAVGEAAVSGVSLVDSISILIIQLLAALSTGGAVVCAQYLGKKRPDQACEAAGQLVLITVCLSLAVSVAALIGNRHLLAGIFGKVEEEVMENAMIYFFLSALSYPFLAIYNSCAALFRAMGNSKVSMKISMAMNFINVAGNALCVFGLKMGVEGVGIPTLVSRAFAAVVMMILIQKPGHVIHLTNIRGLRFNKGMVSKILSVGIPNGLESSIFQFGKLILQSLVSSLGTTALASYAVACNLVTILYLPGNSLGLGLITIVGQCVGAGEYKQAKQYTRNLVLLDYGILLVLCTVMFAGSGSMVGIYQLSPEAAVSARELIQSHCYAMVVWPLAFAVPYMLRASFDARFTMIVSIASMWIFRIGFAYLFVLGFHLGVAGIWYAMFIDWGFRAVVFFWRYLGYEKRMKKISSSVNA